jgi:hypothetical protein
LKYKRRIRQAGGMKTTQQAIEEIVQENRIRYQEALDDAIMTEQDPDNRAALELWRALSPADPSLNYNIPINSY